MLAKTVLLPVRQLKQTLHIMLLVFNIPLLMEYELLEKVRSSDRDSVLPVLQPSGAGTYAFLVALDYTAFIIQLFKSNLLNHGYLQHCCVGFFL